MSFAKILRDLSLTFVIGVLEVKTGGIVIVNSTDQTFVAHTSIDILGSLPPLEQTQYLHWKRISFLGTAQTRPSLIRRGCCTVL